MVTSDDRMMTDAAMAQGMKWLSLIGLAFAALAGGILLLPEAPVPAVRPVAQALPAAAAMAPAQPAPPPVPAAVRPRFDVARIGARGMLVSAGRAAAGAEVVLFDGGRELGRARADSRGEWVILPADPLPPGMRELSLTARLAGGEPLASEDSILLLVPEPAQPQAAMAMLLPPTAGGAAQPRILQAPAGTAPERQRLGLDVVDYDEQGGMRFAGSAPPGATLRLYVGRDHAGDAVADNVGRWVLSPATQPAYGRHTLRVDQLAAAGTVAARIELPFQRDRLPEEGLADGRLVVQPGANLWRIARKVYGRGTRYTVIYDANREQIRDPNRIYPGQTFALPDGPAEAESSRSR